MANCATSPIGKLKPSVDESDRYSSHNILFRPDGGFAGFVSSGLEAGKFRVFDLAFDWTRPCFWVVFVGGIVANLASYTSDQCVVQRYMTTPD